MSESEIENNIKKRSPAIRCWINHILEGTFDLENKTLKTIFGEVKRVRLAGTITRASEIITENIYSNEDVKKEDREKQYRKEFDLDDGTGLIRLIVWGEKNNRFREIEIGQSVDVIGIVRYWNNYLSITPEIMREIKDPNLLLLRNAEILLKIKKGNIIQIQEKENIIHEETKKKDMAQPSIVRNSDQLKEIVFTLIKKETKISIVDINNKIKIPLIQLKQILRELELESKIYQSNLDIYESYT